MEFTFLGTSAGTPTKSRNVTGLALQHGGPSGWYLIDCGEGTQHQLLRTRLSLHQLRAIFITHIHGDHTFGLPGLLSSASMDGRTQPLSIIAPPQVQCFVETALVNSDSTLGFPLIFFDSETTDFSWADSAIKVSTVALSHRVPSHAFVFTENNVERKLATDKLRNAGIEPGPAWGLLQRGQDIELDNGQLLRSADYVEVSRSPRRIVVGGDNDTPSLLAEACREAQVLIHEATYTQEVSERVGPAPQHSSAEQVGRFAQSVDLPNLVLTHFSPRYQFAHHRAPLIDELAREAAQFYQGNLYLARDFATYHLKKDMSLVPPSSSLRPQGITDLPGWTRSDQPG